MSRTGRVIATLVVMAGLILGIVIYVEWRGSSDGQILLVWPFLIFWTAVGILIVWVLDGLFGRPRRRR